jgi:hypothetical protein
MPKVQSWRNRMPSSRRSDHLCDMEDLFKLQRGQFSEWWNASGQSWLLGDRLESSRSSMWRSACLTDSLTGSLRSSPKHANSKPPE